MILIDLFSILLSAAFYPCMALLLVAGVVGVVFLCIWLVGIFKMIFIDTLKRIIFSNNQSASEL